MKINGYLPFKTTTSNSFNVKISDSFKQKLFLTIFYSIPFAFSYKLPKIEGLATKVNLNQIQKYFGFGLLVIIKSKLFLQVNIVES
jgi:hypothetical protein